MNTLFKSILGGLSLICTGAALGGATHQLFFSAICGAGYMVLRAEIRKNKRLRKNTVV